MNDEPEIKIHELPPLSVATSKYKRSPFEWVLAAVACEIAVVNFGLGLTLILASPLRTAAPSFDPLKQLMPMVAWGWFFVGTGSLAIITQFFLRLNLVALLHAIAGTCCLFWSAAFIIGLSNPLASATGIWAYFGLGMTHWLVTGTTFVRAAQFSRLNKMQRRTP